MGIPRLLQVLLWMFVGIGAVSVSSAQPPIPPPLGVKAPLHVTNLSLKADPARFEGPCPKTVNFVGTIAVNRAGTVRYTFLRSDGARGPVHEIRFDGPGSKEVSTSWQLGRSYAGWMAIKILAPREMESNRANFELRCTLVVPPDLLPKEPGIPLPQGRPLPALGSISGLVSASTSPAIVVAGRHLKLGLVKDGRTVGETTVALDSSGRASYAFRGLPLGTYTVRIGMDIRETLPPPGIGANACVRSFGPPSRTVTLNRDRSLVDDADYSFEWFLLWDSPGGCAGGWWY